jgi:parallel beta-helix repeat protein
LLNRFGGRGRLSLVLVLIPSLATVAATSAAAKTLYVKPKGHNNTACTSVKPCRTIGFAVGQAHPGDTVRVAQGTYRATVSITKDIKLVGINRPVIEATRRINGILVSGARAKGAVVDGFAVRDALQEGILVTRTAAVTITDNLVHFNDKGAAGAHPTGECAPAGAIPGDCGEGLHLMTVTDATVTGNTVSDNLGGILITDEFGPTSDNLISHNRVMDNVGDCGITLAGHDPGAFSKGKPNPSQGGVYANDVIDNLANGNGTKGLGGGILLAAGVPGAGVYANVVRGNVANGNGLGGLTLHSHAPNQDFNGNQIIDNSFGHDAIHGFPTGAPGDDQAGISHTAGIIIFSEFTKLVGTVVRGNRLSNEYYGIWTQNVPRLRTKANTFAKSVTTKLFQK